MVEWVAGLMNETDLILGIQKGDSDSFGKIFDLFVADNSFRNCIGNDSEIFE